MEYERRNPRDVIFEYMVPSSCWTENSDSHCLLIDLPGFKKEEVRIRADNYGRVIISGERQANYDKIIHFEQSFKVPESCEIEDTSAILEDEIFYVTMPKKPEKQAPQLQNNVSYDNNNDDYNQNNERSTEEEEGKQVPQVQNNVSYDNNNDDDYNQNNERITEEDQEKQVPQVQNNVSYDNNNDDDYNQNNERITEEEEEEEEEECRRSKSENKLSKSSLLQKIKESRNVVLIAVIAFSLGVFVSHRYQPTAQVERSQ